MPAATLRRLAPGAVLALAATALSGCVYLRLLELKHQFADFDRHFAVETAHGVRIECRDPVLLASDLRWLGMQPESVRRLGQAEQWRIRWVREQLPGKPETDAYDVVLDAGFLGQKLTRLSIEESFFAFFPKSLFLKFLRSAGSAQIDREKREAEIATAVPGGEAAEKLPSARTIEHFLGAPDNRTAAGGRLTLRYHYRPAAPPGAKVSTIEVTFVFDERTGRMQAFNARLPAGSLHFNLSAAGGPGQP